MIEKFEVLADMNVRRMGADGSPGTDEDGRSLRCNINRSSNSTLSGGSDTVCKFL